MHRYKELEVWKQSRIFCKTIYEVSADFPDHEKFGLVNQLRRAVISIPSNIAEGASRTSKKDFARFLEISLGSCYEVETQLIISEDLGYIDKNLNSKSLNELNSIIKM